MIQGPSRRSFLSFLPLVAAAQKPVRKAKAPLPRAGEFSRYFDSQTEHPVVRLTALSSSSFLPPSSNRISPARERFLLFASDRDDSLSPYTMDLRNGTATQLADTSELNLKSLQLAGSGRSAYFIDGGILMEANTSTRKATALAEDVSAVAVGGGLNDYLFIRGGKLFRGGTTGRSLVDGVNDLCGVRPGQAACLCLRNGGQELLYASFREAGTPRLTQITKSQPIAPCWSPDGRSVLFLRRQAMEKGIEGTVIVEVIPEEGMASAKVVALTSGYAGFAPNSDTSVFVGASGSKAQPSILLLLRSTGRELTLCEHRAKMPMQVNPAFSPDNRRIYFASDFQGRPAIYAVNVEMLVEPAGS